MSKIQLTDEEIQSIKKMWSLVESGQYYRLLEIGLNADAETIQNSYYRLSKRWHPDAYFTKETGPHATTIAFLGG